MRIADEDNANRTVYCGNLSEDVTDAILYELFNQAGPVECVRRPRDQNGRPKCFAFVIYKHDCSVPYAIELLRGNKLFNRKLNMNSHSRLSHIPVLDTHLTEFSQFGATQISDPRNHEENHFKNGWENDSRSYSESDYKRNQSDRGNRREENHRSGGSNRHRHSNQERNHNEPTSWAEFNTLRGKGSLSNGYNRDDLQGSSRHNRESDQKVSHGMLDFNALLQMGQQMMLPGMMGVPGGMPMMGVPGGMPMMGLGPSMGANMFPSMQGKLSGGERNSHDAERGRRDRNEERGHTRQHPYNDRRCNDHRDDHRRHDRGYSASRSSHDRERRDRRSR